jgi:hypothetical protein
MSPGLSPVLSPAMQLSQAVTQGWEEREAGIVLGEAPASPGPQSQSIPPFAMDKPEWVCYLVTESLNCSSAHAQVWGAAIPNHQGVCVSQSTTLLAWELWWDWRHQSSTGG